MTAFHHSKLNSLVISYISKIYNPFDKEIKQCLISKPNEIYGELYYYSVVKLLKYLKITENDHFLDIGSGLGKIALQIFLTTNAASVTGIEINKKRHKIAYQLQAVIKQQLPELFSFDRSLNLIEGDFLQYDFKNIHIIYICSAIFSFELLEAVGKKINTMNSVKKVVSFRKLPYLDKFEITQKLFLHASWDKIACFIYSRKANDKLVNI
jgi:16S rRNA A1518/A1519 N6-dimethyltransferase RsmA/KsgA/DIM1 with predicted DNA glycosylase/AP lyase activity